MEIKICAYCKTNPVKRIGKIYCSKDCFSKANTGEKNNKWKGGQIKKICLICSKDFLVDQYRAGSKTCSLNCHKLYFKTEEFRMNQSEIIRSNINKDLQYLSNIVSKFKNLLRRCSKYSMWRERIFKRDNFICQICKVRGGKLCADHIEPFILLIYRNKIESYEDAIKCNELWDINNGRTLCLPCHYKTPTFGSKVQKKLLESNSNNGNKLNNKI
ncbi:hypothetical protein HY311_01905 [Candidatus Nomurabacteria bacterium]|nr:hypothetical protein [Candidatus Nomurabacteria bacterium]